MCLCVRETESERKRERERLSQGECVIEYNALTKAALLEHKTIIVDRNHLQFTGQLLNDDRKHDHSVLGKYYVYGVNHFKSN